MAEQLRTVLLVIRFSPERVKGNHIKEYAPKIKACIDRMATGGGCTAFSSPDGQQIGYFLRTSMPLRAIRAELYGTSRRSSEAVLLNGDHYLALEIGLDFDGVGQSKAWTWLQHHHIEDA